MKWILSLQDIQEGDRRKVGGKCFALAQMSRNGLKVPETYCIPSEAYETYLEGTGLRERILTELNRKDFKDMRWEEIWDSSLRIRNMFLTGPGLGDVFPELATFIQWRFKWKALVIRSSSPEEDSKRASFAGLHESYVNVRGTESILDHVKLVWASLWSDAALLYRQELELDVSSSAMAVVLQELIVGERSGVIFSRSPNSPHEGLIESVYGLNQGLVDGTVEPDRWVFDRKTAKVMSHSPARRDQWITLGRRGVREERLPTHLAEEPPLKGKEVSRLVDTALRVEKLFGGPQDIEWTMKGNALWILQSRPITTLVSSGSEDKRQWYLSLRRSFQNLKALRGRIEGELVPRMIADAAALAAVDLVSLSDEQLADEIVRRTRMENRWVTLYWDEFIPFAHGMRLFGQVYNDVMRPEDPYEFIALLASSEMESVKRNRLLETMAALVRQNQPLRRKLTDHEYLAAGEQFLRTMSEFIERFGDLSCPVTGVVQCDQGPEALIRLVLEMAEHPPKVAGFEKKDLDALTEEFLNRFGGDRLQEAAELLDLARASYRMRDDDNIHLARIEAQKLAAVDEAKRRIRDKGAMALDRATRGEIEKILADPKFIIAGPPIRDSKTNDSAFTVKPRQLTGQPAGQGISRGEARVILDPADLAQFKYGEILVCDSVDPNMTFIVPLASGIVERRGGMLIHGAIIAREYGIPCITGISDATRWIRTGDFLTVDGYLGIVTIGESTQP